MHALNKYCDIRKAQVGTNRGTLLPSSNTEHILMYSSEHERAGLITRVLFTCEALHAVLSEALGQCFKDFYCISHHNFWALLPSVFPWLHALLEAETFIQ